MMSILPSETVVRTASEHTHTRGRGGSIIELGERATATLQKLECMYYRCGGVRGDIHYGCCVLCALNKHTRNTYSVYPGIVYGPMAQELFSLHLFVFCGSRNMQYGERRLLHIRLLFLSNKFMIILCRLPAFRCLPVCVCAPSLPLSISCRNKRRELSEKWTPSKWEE